jgi:hypothetical protein
MQSDSAAASAVQKLERFYASLEPDERKVIALIVSSSLQRAARAQAERDWLQEGEALLDIIGSENAPGLVADLGTMVAGQLAAGQAAVRQMGQAEKRSL